MHGWHTARHTYTSEMIIWIQRPASSENKSLKLQSSNIYITLISADPELVLPHTYIAYMF